MTPDLIRLSDNLEKLKDIVEYLELELVNNPIWDEPSDVSYLNDRDLADPDIVGNVKAMIETNRLISWIGHDFEGFIGFWHGAENRGPKKASIVRLDTEGQYSIVAYTIADYLAVSCHKDDFLHNRNLLISVGFDVSESVDEIWKSINGTYNSANEYRNAIYNQERINRGLNPIRI